MRLTQSSRLLRMIRVAGILLQEAPGQVAITVLYFFAILAPASLADLWECSMELNRLSKTLFPAIVLPAALYLGSALMPAQSQPHPGEGNSGQACPNDDSGLKLPPGFCATVFADDIGHARHMVVSPSGVVYVNTWSGVYYGNKRPHEGGFLVALRDTTGAGKADVIERFGETAEPPKIRLRVAACFRNR